MHQCERGYEPGADPEPLCPCGFAPDDRICAVGRTGNGKSTLANIAGRQAPLRTVSGAASKWCRAILHSPIGGIGRRLTPSRPCRIYAGNWRTGARCAHMAGLRISSVPGERPKRQSVGGNARAELALATWHQQHDDPDEPTNHLDYRCARRVAEGPERFRRRGAPGQP